MITLLANMLPTIGKFFKSKEMDVKLQEKIMLIFFSFVGIIYLLIRLTGFNS